MMAPELLGGRYELRGVLGRGGVAEVRDGWDTRLSRAVAVKLLHPGFANHPETRERFDAEARSAAGLSNPHIVAVHDTGEHNGTPFIVMERLPGASLADYIMRGPLPQPLVRSVLDGVLAALAAAHDRGILHRDIKPGNILFTSDGETKVSDFGIAKTADAGDTMTGQVVGTMACLSPERLMGNPATPSDDLYVCPRCGWVRGSDGAQAVHGGQPGGVGPGDPRGGTAPGAGVAARRRPAAGGGDRTRDGPRPGVAVPGCAGDALRRGGSVADDAADAADGGEAADQSAGRAAAAVDGVRACRGTVMDEAEPQATRRGSRDRSCWPR